MTDHELTRRDALAALAASGVATASLGALTLVPTDDDPVLDRNRRETLVALARTIYPDEVSGVPTFVDTYVAGRIEDRPAYRAGVVDSIVALDEHVRTFHDAPFREVAPDRRDETLRGFSLDQVDPDPDGSRRERVRYYLVNELQYALYTSPTGGELVGIENPQGHPGGLGSYQRGPPDADDTDV